MQTPIADNFDLYIAAEAKGQYAFRVFCSQGETPTPELATIPQEQAPVSNWLKQLHAGTISDATLQALGIELYTWLFPPGLVRELYKSSLDKVRREGKRLRIRLHLAPTALAALPWEYVYDVHLNNFLALNPYTWLVRYLDLPIAPGSVTSLTPVPVLLVAVQPTDHQSQLNLTKEITELLDVCKPLLKAQAITFDVLFGGAEGQRLGLAAAIEKDGSARLLPATATLEKLRQTIRQGEYRIFHFMGHGAFSDSGFAPDNGTRVDSRGFRPVEKESSVEQLRGHLLFVNEDTRTDYISGETLANLLGDSGVAFALLNACKSAAATPHEIFTSAAACLIQAGLPAAIAMQTDIHDNCAIRFARTLYATLADGWPLDAAVTEGRNAIHGDRTTTSPDWGAPVLYLRAPDGQIFQRGVSIEDLEKPLATFNRQSVLAVEQARQAQEQEREQIAAGLAAYTQRLQTSILAVPTPQDAAPYRGLLAYRLNDSVLFFGRDRALQQFNRVLERDVFTILHARSGAGKTSLLQAGIAPALIAAGHLVLFIRPYNLSPTLALKHLVIGDLDQSYTVWQKPLSVFVRQMRTLLSDHLRLYIIFDQFEEFFTQLPKPAQVKFMDELAVCLNDQHLRVHWVLALRSEYFGQLAVFTQLGTHLLNQFALEELTPTEALDAVIRPISAYGIRLEEGLAAAIIADVQQEIEVTNDVQHMAILPPQLQLVCLTLFEKLAIPVEHAITRAMYDNLGGARGILQGRLEEVLQHELPTTLRNAARLVLEALVTSDGLRSLRSQSALEEELDRFRVAATTTEATLNKLTEHRLLQVREHHSGPTERFYELAHDYLIDKITLEPGVRRRKEAEELLIRALINWRDYQSLMDVRTFPRINEQRENIAISAEAWILLTDSAIAANIDREWWLTHCPQHLTVAFINDALSKPNRDLRVLACKLAPEYYQEQSIRNALLLAAAQIADLELRELAFAVIDRVDPIEAKRLFHPLLLDLLSHTVSDTRLRGLQLLPGSLDDELQQALWLRVIRDDDKRVWQQALMRLTTTKTTAPRFWQPLWQASLPRQAEIYDLVRQQQLNLPLTEWPRLSLAYGLCWAALRLSHFYTASFRFLSAAIVPILVLIVGGVLAGNWWMSLGWQALPGEESGLPIQSLLISDDKIYVGGRDNGVQRYANGQWWPQWRVPPVASDIEGYLPAITALAVDPAAPDYLLAYVLRNGLYQLNLQSQHWEQLGEALPLVDQVVVATDHGRLLYATATEGLFVSTDSGQQWKPATDKKLGMELRVAFFNQNGVAYVGGQNGLFRSMDVKFDTDWGEPVFNGPVHNVALGTEGHLFIVEEDSQQAACYTELPTFHRVGNAVPFFWNFPGRTIELLAANPHNPSQFFVADNAGRLYAFACNPSQRTLLGKVWGLQKGVYGIGIYREEDISYLVQVNGKGIYRLATVEHRP